MAFWDTVRASLSFEGKALSASGRTSAIPGSRDSAPDVYGATYRRSNSRFAAASAKRQLEAYASGTDKAMDWVADCMGVIAETAAHAAWHLEDYDGKVAPRSRADAEKGSRLADPWLVQLLEEPNGYQSYEEVIELFVIDRFITGDGFLYKRGEDSAGRPLQLLRLPPQSVEVIPGDKGELIKSYEYKVPGQEPVQIAPEKVIHWKGANPHDSHRGAGIIAMGPRVFDGEIALTDTKASYYENGARLEGVLEAEQAISESTAAKLRRQFAGIYAGARQAFQVAVLGRGLQYKPIQSDAVKAEFGAMSNQSRDRILALFRVPKVMLGLPIDTSATTGPGEERRNFDNKRMRPILDTLQKLLTRELTADFGLQLKIDYEYQMPIEDQFKLGGEFAKVPGVLVKEVRKQFNLKPLAEVMSGPKASEAEEIENLVLNLPGENNNTSGVKDQPLPGEPGRAPDPSNTATFDERAQRQGAAAK
jgi:HK97 family phage portal protein